MFESLLNEQPLGLFPHGKTQEICRQASEMNTKMSEEYFSSHSKGQSNLTSHFGTKCGCILYSQARENCLKGRVRITD